MVNFAISKLLPNSQAMTLAAQWRYDAFLKDDGYSVEDSAAQLDKLATRPDGCETALIASVEGEPVGVCLLVSQELPPAHDLTPWLASLYVVPGFRKRGIARKLIYAVEDHAKSFGISRLHLYTGEAEGLYARCGWQVMERLESRLGPFVLMTREL